MGQFFDAFVSICHTVRKDSGVKTPKPLCVIYTSYVRNVTKVTRYNISTSFKLNIHL
jgi:hypothetical protein